jgi:hypothetical protein
MILRSRDFKTDRGCTDQADPQFVAHRSNENAPVTASHGQSVGNRPSADDPVKAALAVALTASSAAGQWSTVEILTRELEARRRSRAGVVDLAHLAKRNG